MTKPMIKTHSKAPMSAIEALQTRSSSPRLTEPGPSPQSLTYICKSALRAADHGMIRPWRFLIVEGGSREKLGELFLKASLTKTPNLKPQQKEIIKTKALRAPTIIIAIANPQDHPKVPIIEQEYSAAAAVQNMSLAAFALGIGSVWRTGAFAYDAIVHEGLGLNKGEKIIGFLYIGTRSSAAKPFVELDTADYFKAW